MSDRSLLELVNSAIETLEEIKARLEDGENNNISASGYEGLETGLSESIAEDSPQINMVDEKDFNVLPDGDTDSAKEADTGNEYDHDDDLVSGLPTNPDDDWKPESFFEPIPEQIQSEIEQIQSEPEQIPPEPVQMPPEPIQIPPEPEPVSVSPQMSTPSPFPVQEDGTAPQKMEFRRFCKQCGNELKPQSIFCKFCGTKVD